VRISLKNLTPRQGPQSTEMKEKASIRCSAVDPISRGTKDGNTRQSILVLQTMTGMIAITAEEATEITIRVEENLTKKTRNRQDNTIDSTIISIGVREIPQLKHQEKDLSVAIMAAGRHNHQILYRLILCSIPKEAASPITTRVAA